MAITRFTNKDGLVETYGTRAASDDAKFPRKVSSRGVVQSLVLPFSYSDITADSGTGFYDADASGGSTPDSFSSAVNAIPAGSTIVAAYLTTRTAWAGTATIDIGFWTQAGVVIDIDALYDGLDVDHTDSGMLTVGAAPFPNGVAVQQTSGTFDPDWHDTVSATTADLYLRVCNADAGTLTAGASTLVVEYIPPMA
jgi:hypothetical protein